MRKAAMICVLAAVALVAYDAGCPSVTTFTDSRDGKTYKKVTIGKQTWMKENLNYEAKGSVCYDNKADNCAKYGRLYNWNTAMAACPAGWHLPSDKEWTTLLDYLGDKDWAGTKLKSTSGWTFNGNGTDEYLFSALPGGMGIGGYYIAGDKIVNIIKIDSHFSHAGNQGYWWCATPEEYAVNASSRYPDNDDYAGWDNYMESPFSAFRYMGYDCDYVNWGSSPKIALFSVRCVQD
jgi:uncharacterized protein (TIGR02145 family)